MATVKRNWADLPQELLPLIVKRLPDISVFIHYRAICKPWRSSVSISDLPPQFPWILKFGKGPDLEFYSIASNKVCTIHAPNFSDKDLYFEPATGYMLARRSSNRNRFSLIDPLNNSEVCLPDLDSFSISVFCNGPQNFQRDDFSVVVKDYFLGLLVCKPGDDKWDCITRDSSTRCFYIKSLLFMVDIVGITRVMDLGSHKEVFVIPPPKDEEFPMDPCAYLVESCGEIFRVCRPHPYNMEDDKFHIHRLEFGNGEGHPCWVKVRSIGDQMLFLDLSILRGFGLSSNNFAGFKGNSIYFIHSTKGAYKLGLYDIENGNTEFINCPFSCEKITWYVPTLNHI